MSKMYSLAISATIFWLVSPAKSVNSALDVNNIQSIISDIVRNVQGYMKKIPDEVEFHLDCQGPGIVIFLYSKIHIAKKPALKMPLPLPSLNEINATINISHTKPNRKGMYFCIANVLTYNNEPFVLINSAAAKIDITKFVQNKLTNKLYEMVISPLSTDFEFNWKWNLGPKEIPNEHLRKAIKNGLQAILNIQKSIKDFFGKLDLLIERNKIKDIKYIPPDKTDSMVIAKVVKSPMDTKVDMFEKVSLQCLIESSENINIVWYKGSKSLKPYGSKPYGSKPYGSRINIVVSQEPSKTKGMLMTTSSLTLHRVLRSDRGRYRCHAVSGKKTLTKSRPALLRVKPPVITVVTPPTRVEIEEHGSAFMMCKFKSTTKIKIRWQRKTHRFPRELRSSIYTSQYKSNNFYMTYSRLNITKAKSSYAGDYRCRARVGRKTTVTAYARVNIIPSTPPVWVPPQKIETPKHKPATPPSVWVPPQRTTTIEQKPGISGATTIEQKPGTSGTTTIEQKPAEQIQSTIQNIIKTIQLYVKDIPDGVKFQLDCQGPGIIIFLHASIDIETQSLLKIPLRVPSLKQINATINISQFNPRNDGVYYCIANISSYSDDPLVLVNGAAAKLDLTKFVKHQLSVDLHDMVMSQLSPDLEFNWQWNLGPKKIPTDHVRKALRNGLKTVLKVQRLIQDLYGKLDVTIEKNKVKDIKYKPPDKKEVIIPHDLEEVADVVESPKDEKVNEFDRAVLHCSIESSKEVDIVWYKGSKNLKSDRQRIIIRTYHKPSKNKGKIITISSLTLSRALKSDLGKYKCRALTDKRILTESKEAVLKIKSPVIIKVELQPNSVKIKEHGSGFIMCKFKSTTKVTVRWQMNGHDIPHELKSHIYSSQYQSKKLYMTSSRLNIRNALLSHAGNYRCLAEAQHKTVMTEYGHVDVIPSKLEVLVQPHKLAVKENEDGFLLCVLKSSTKAKLWWEKEYDMMPSRLRKFVTTKQYLTNGSYMIFSKIEVKHAKTHFSGKYRCIAKGRGRSVVKTRYAELLVLPRDDDTKLLLSFYEDKEEKISPIEANAPVIIFSLLLAIGIVVISTLLLLGFVYYHKCYKVKGKISLNDMESKHSKPKLKGKASIVAGRRLSRKVNSKHSQTTRTTPSSILPRLSNGRNLKMASTSGETFPMSPFTISPDKLTRNAGINGYDLINAINETSMVKSEDGLGQQAPTQGMHPMRQSQSVPIIMEEDLNKEDNGDDKTYQSCPNVTDLTDFAVKTDTHNAKPSKDSIKYSDIELLGKHLYTLKRSSSFTVCSQNGTPGSPVKVIHVKPKSAT